MRDEYCIRILKQNMSNSVLNVEKWSEWIRSHCEWDLPVLQVPPSVYLSLLEVHPMVWHHCLLLLSSGFSRVSSLCQIFRIIFHKRELTGSLLSFCSRCFKLYARGLCPQPYFLDSREQATFQFLLNVCSQKSWLTWQKEWENEGTNAVISMQNFKTNF